MKKITLLLSFIACVVFAQAQTNLFSEDFSHVTATATADANGNIADSKDYGTLGKLDSVIVTNPGWAGVKVYCSNGQLKIGTSSTMGNFTTPAINLSNGSFIITVDLASWNNTGNTADTGSSIDVLIDGSVVATLNYTTTKATYSTSIITAKTATSKINFAAKVAKNRFYIDNILVAAVTDLRNTNTNRLQALVSGKNLLINNVTEGSNVEIYSALGSKVQTSTLENGKVSLSNLAKGMYVVRVGKLTQKFML